MGATLINLELPDIFWGRKELADLKPRTRIISQDPRYLEYAGKISDELANPKRLSLIGVEGFSLQILDLFLKLNNQPEQGSLLLGKIDAYLHGNFTKALTLDQIANKYEVAPDWLSRKFCLYYGESLSDRITRLRVNQAIHLLAGSSKTLAEIAVHVGFFDQSHFTRTFKKLRGVSPGQYRRALRPK
jgi:AraC-like DNA-binding protein